MTARLFTLAYAALAVSGCATQAASAPDGRDCFQNAQISRYSVIDDHRVRVSVGPSRRYILSTNWNAHDLVWREAIAFVRPPTGSARGSGLGVEVIGGRPRRHYPINSIEREPEPQPPTESQ
jgi:hypothetical protein